jgi:NAD(P)H-dependent FMN reductase
LIAASPGQLGGLRALFALRGLLQNLQVVVVPAMAATPRLQEESFGPDGELADPAAVRRITDVAGRLVETARKLAVGG